ncbi:hypothetical protein BZG36_00641 [Bifiguratus adelaidae]|uniref:Glycosyl transferase family 1 domain-containing protein n=1 Tax=Bifiguratus adelaidae TaxID=1938954 RepID=A0A261Y7K2_9FUNG|nr:hypothetical protein BZG36_00641 [Bifiguratus adelaidae]
MLLQKHQSDRHECDHSKKHITFFGCAKAIRFVAVDETREMITSRPIRSRFLQLLIFVLINLSIVGLVWHLRNVTTTEPIAFEKVENVPQKMPALETALSAEPKAPGGKAKVAILNGYGAHDEVVVSFLYAFSQMKEADVHLYFDSPRFGIQSIVNGFYDKPLKSMMSFAQDAVANGDPDMVVLTSCDTYDLSRATPTLLAMADRNANVKVMCVMHNPQHPDDIKHPLSSLASKSVLNMVGLSPHVVDFINTEMLPKLAQGVNEAFTKVPTILFVPNFPYDVPDRCGSSSSLDNKDCQTAFVVQGLFESFRRDYNSLFEHLQQKLRWDEASWKNFKLRLLGQGSPFDLQEPLSKYITTRNNIPYLDYYYDIHHNVALLPAFGSDDYYEFKASSSVGAALLTGVPLVANKRLLETYRHLSMDGVYYQNDGEHVIDTVERIRMLSPEMMEEKRANATKMNERIIADNIDTWRSLLK